MVVTLYLFQTYFCIMNTDFNISTFQWVSIPLIPLKRDYWKNGTSPAPYLH